MMGHPSIVKARGGGGRAWRWRGAGICSISATEGTETTEKSNNVLCSL